MSNSDSQIAETRKQALSKFHEQVIQYPELLAALSTENLANLLYDRERSDFADNEIYVHEMEMRVGGRDNWIKIKEQSTKINPPTWSETIKSAGFDPEQRLRHQ